RAPLTAATYSLSLHDALPIFDADEAGSVAVDRSVELFLTRDVEIAIASMPAGVDPDEYLMQHGAEGFDKLVGEARDVLSYKWSRSEEHTSELQSRGHLVCRLL